MNVLPYLISTAVHLLALITLTLPFAARQREPSLVLLDPSPTAAQQVSGGAALEVTAPAQGAGEMSVAARDDAVGSALAWLADVQHTDGGWSLHRQPADVKSTSLALLAFASAHQTHKTGKYKETVKNGLLYLSRQGDLRGEDPPTGLRFPAPTNPHRAQALATLALATHYSMTHDKGLAEPSQLAINELCEQPVTSQETAEDIGWRLLALKEAHAAYLQVPAAAVQSLKSACDERAQATSEIEPGVLLARVACSLAGGPPYAQLEHLKAQRPQGRDLAESYFTGIAVSHYRPTTESCDCLRAIQRDILTASPSLELDIEQTSLRVLILQLRPPRHLIFESSAAEDDFPL